MTNPTLTENAILNRNHWDKQWDVRLHMGEVVLRLSLQPSGFVLLEGRIGHLWYPATRTTCTATTASTIGCTKASLGTGSLWSTFALFVRLAMQCVKHIPILGIFRYAPALTLLETEMITVSHLLGLIVGIGICLFVIWLRER